MAQSRHPQTPAANADHRNPSDAAARDDAPTDAAHEPIALPATAHAFTDGDAAAVALTGENNAAIAFIAGDGGGDERDTIAFAGNANAAIAEAARAPASHAGGSNDAAPAQDLPAANDGVTATSGGDEAGAHRDAPRDTIGDAARNAIARRAPIALRRDVAAGARLMLSRPWRIQSALYGDRLGSLPDSIETLLCSAERIAGLQQAAGLTGHWTYSLNRYIAARQALLALRLLRRRGIGSIYDLEAA